MARKDQWMLDLIQNARPWQLGAALRSILRYGPEEHEVRGFRVWLDPASNVGYRLLRFGDLEPEMTSGIERILQPGDVFVDLGGNEGWFSLVAARAVGPTGRVVCVEPQERLWPVVLRNFAMNGFAQCELVPVAVGTEAKAEITLAPSVNTGASSMAVRAKKPLVHKRQEVIMRTLDSIVDDRRIPRVHLLKVDIEGYELFALRSGERLLREGRISNVLIEFHDPQLHALGQSREEILSLLKETGYRHVEERTGIHHFAR